MCFPLKGGPVLSEEMGSLCNSCIAPSHSLSLYFSYLGWAVVIPVPDHPSLEEAHLQYWWLVLCGWTKDDWTITSARHLLVKVKRRPEVRLGNPITFRLYLHCGALALGLQLFLLLLPFFINLILTPLLFPQAWFFLPCPRIFTTLAFDVLLFFLLVKDITATLSDFSGLKTFCTFFFYFSAIWLLWKSIAMCLIASLLCLSFDDSDLLFAVPQSRQFIRLH